MCDISNRTFLSLQAQTSNLTKDPSWRWHLKKKGLLYGWRFSPTIKNIPLDCANWMQWQALTGDGDKSLGLFHKKVPIDNATKKLGVGRYAHSWLRPICSGGGYRVRHALEQAGQISGVVVKPDNRTRSSYLGLYSLVLHLRVSLFLGLRQRDPSSTPERTLPPEN